MNTRPIRTIALQVDTVDGETQFCAVDGDHSWSGRVNAPNLETAVLDAAAQIRAQSTVRDRVRLLVDLDADSHLWAHASEVAMLLPGVSIEAPGPFDQALMTAAAGGLQPAAPVEGPPLVVATDGSVRGKFTGYGWLADSGDFDLRGFPHAGWQVGTSAVLISELRAIDNAIRHLPQRSLTVLTDSREAITMLQKWMAGEDTLPAGYTTERRSGTAGLVEARERIRLQQNRINLCWVPGHTGDLLNEGADALARLASRYAQGDPQLSRTQYRERAAGIAEAFSTAFRTAA
ncbi:MAG: ribonuclease H family protein [Mycobacterium sp.]